MNTTRVIFATVDIQIIISLYITLLFILTRLLYYIFICVFFLLLCYTFTHVSVIYYKGWKLFQTGSSCRWTRVGELAGSPSLSFPHQTTPVKPSGSTRKRSATGWWVADVGRGRTGPSGRSPHKIFGLLLSDKSDTIHT